jgi:hypothetical protein
VRGADNLATFMCRLFTNYGSLNLLQPSGLVEACVRNALPLLFSAQFLANFLISLFVPGNIPKLIIVFRLVQPPSAKNVHIFAWEGSSQSEQMVQRTFS